VTVLLAAGGIVTCYWSPEETWLRITRLLLLEAVSAIALFGVLVSVWVIAKPGWAKILLEKRLRGTLGWAFGIGVTLMILFILVLIFG